jgi:predicted AlkP superfamily pyrophosphatase or phosphodiesterase
MLKTLLLRIAVLCVAIALSLAFACQSGGPPEIRAERVVMVSFDGVGADLAWRWIADGTAASPDGLRGLAETGFSAERLRMVDPTLTAVNHATLVTGHNAAGTGIVNNWYRDPGTPMIERVSGFTASSDAETLWKAARRSGLTVATLVWPGADGEAPDRMGDFGAVWPGPPLAASELLDLEPDTAGTTGEVPSNDGLVPLLWRFEVGLGSANPKSVTALVALVDSNPDGKPRYDAAAMRLENAPDWSYVGEMEWFELGFEAQGGRDDRPRRYGAWCKMLRIDRLNGTLRLYLGGAHRLRAYPEAFEDRLTEAIGPWPGEPDREQLAAWWLDLAAGIDLDTFLEQSERLDRYLDRMAEWVLAEEDPDLVLAYHPSADEYQHASLITDDLQWAYSPGRALAAREGLARVGRSIDASVKVLWSALEPERDALVVVSDHGMVPIHEVVRPNTVLEAAGLLRTASDGRRPRIAPDTPMVATASGAAINLYLNLEGREPDGVVSPSETPELLRRAARAFADLEVEGRPVTEKIFTRAEAAAVGLDSPNSGDLVVFLAPGFAASAGLVGAVHEPSRYYGQHGYLANHDEMCGMLFARGAGIRKTRGGEVPATAVAPMVARWLGIDLVGAGAGGE